MPDAGADDGAGADGGTAVAPAPTLLERGATLIRAISPDRSRILVSHGAPSAGNLSLVTIGGATKTLAAQGAYLAAFSPDGRSIVFDTQSGAQPSDLNL